MTPSGTIWPLADRALNGKLATILTSLRAQGFSFEQIAKRLFKSHRIDVTGETVRQWVASLERDA